MSEKTRGYKCFDKNLQCRGFQFEVGKTYIHKGKIALCECGFHFCKKAADAFNYYSFDSNNRVCEVEAEECVDGTDKSVCAKITILRELTWHEVLDVVNTGKGNTGNSNSGDRNSGNWNSGDSNSGNRNSGDRNSGSRNSGDSNSGNWNSGNWNSGNWNSGLFNTNTPHVRLFNRHSKFEWTDKRILAVLGCWPEIHEWVYFDQMTNNEKEQFPHAKTTGGYLKKIEYKEAWKTYWAKANQGTKDCFLNLPFFDCTIFEEITGVDVKAEFKEFKKRRKAMK